MHAILRLPHIASVLAIRKFLMPSEGRIWN
jgi:hypothetical protein